MLNALVVDDSMLIRHTVCRYLEERGFTVETATNGQEALEAIKRLLPDLIITDMQMPKMGGAELITALKSNAESIKILRLKISSRMRCKPCWGRRRRNPKQQENSCLLRGSGQHHSCFCGKIQSGEVTS
jgi:CheY-like chemotaxis protein